MRKRRILPSLLFSFVLVAALIAASIGAFRTAASTVQERVAAAGGAVPTRTSRAYAGHETDRDVANFAARYPAAVGTRLDDCGTCHRAGIAATDTAREFNACGFCHLIPFPNPRLSTGVPKSYEETLNPYGLAYKRAGRSVEALGAIEAVDADGDGASNGVEIQALRLPGDAASRPGQAVAPFVTLSWDRIARLPSRPLVLLMNTSKEPTDDYAAYEGVRVKDVLAAAGADLAGEAGITVFAPDGYGVDFSMDDIEREFPRSVYYNAPRAGGGTDGGFVRTSPLLPAGVRDGQELPGPLYLSVAFRRDGSDLDGAVYEKGTGRLAGEGPFRLIAPQRSLGGDAARPGRPDRSLKADARGDGWDYAPSIDHNAGNCVRGACVIRVNPSPAGVEEYDWKNGWPLVERREIVVYGHGIK